MSPPPFSAAMCPVGTACRFLRTPHRAGNGGYGAACRSIAAVSLQECGGREKQAHSHCQDTHRRHRKKAGATLPYLTNGNVATIPAENREMER